MAWIQGFRGIRYNVEQGGDISDRLSPPFDLVQDQATKDALLARSAYAVTAIDVPHVPPRSLGPIEAYRQAGELLRQWLDRQVLTRETDPAVYLYQQRFNYAGQSYLRRGFIAALRLEPLGSGSVFPHEETHGGPKEDRLQLTKEAKAYISQVFCLFEDDDNALTDQLYAKVSGEADYHGRLDDVANEVWVVKDPATLAWLHEQMQPRRVFIADGHHRYDTAMMYKQWLEQEGTSPLPDDHPANFLACMFVSMTEPGLLVLPTHRSLFGLGRIDLERITTWLTDDYQLTWRHLGNWAEADAILSQTNPLAFGLGNGKDDRLLVAWPKHPESLLSDLADRHSPAWRRLQVAIVHNHALDRVIFKNNKVDPERVRIEYTHHCSEALEAVRDSDDALAVLLQPTNMDAVRQVSLSGDLMPPKSTFFYPKIATGLVVYPMF